MLISPWHAIHSHRVKLYDIIADFGDMSLSKDFVGTEEHHFFYPLLQPKRCTHFTKGSKSCPCDLYVVDEANPKRNKKGKKNEVGKCKECKHVHKKIKCYEGGCSSTSSGLSFMHLICSILLLVVITRKARRTDQQIIAPVDLAPIPTLLVLVDKGRLGDTFPKCFDIVVRACVERRQSAKMTEEVRMKNELRLCANDLFVGYARQAHRRGEELEEHDCAGAGTSLPLRATGGCASFGVGVEQIPEGSYSRTKGYDDRTDEAPARFVVCSLPSQVLLALSSTAYRRDCTQRGSISKR